MKRARIVAIVLLVMVVLTAAGSIVVDALPAVSKEIGQLPIPGFESRLPRTAAFKGSGRGIESLISSDELIPSHPFGSASLNEFPGSFKNDVFDFLMGGNQIPVDLGETAGPAIKNAIGDSQFLGSHDGIFPESPVAGTSTWPYRTPYLHVSLPLVPDREFDSDGLAPAVNPSDSLTPRSPETIPAPGAVLLGALGASLVGWLRRMRWVRGLR